MILFSLFRSYYSAHSFLYARYSDAAAGVVSWTPSVVMTHIATIKAADRRNCSSTTPQAHPPCTTCTTTYTLNLPLFLFHLIL